MKNLLIRSSFLMILLGQATYAETVENFDTDPGWTLTNNPFQDNDFGFRNSNVAGGSPGEAGGFFSVATLPVWYGDESIDTLGANDRVEASGILHIATVDLPYNNNVFIGHFDAGVFSTPGVNGIGFQLLESAAQMGTSEFRIFFTIGDDAFPAFTITSSLGLTRTCVESACGR